MDRRKMIGTAAAALMCVAFEQQSLRKATQMHGLIGKIIAIDGERDALIAILTGAATKMPGCLSYVVAKDRDDANAIWITEVWQDEASHSAALKAPEVRNAIAKGKPLIVGFRRTYCDDSSRRARPESNRESSDLPL